VPPAMVKGSSRGSSVDSNGEQYEKCGVEFIVFGGQPTKLLHMGEHEPQLQKRLDEAAAANRMLHFPHQDSPTKDDDGIVPGKSHLSSSPPMDQQSCREKVVGGSSEAEAVDHVRIIMDDKEKFALSLGVGNDQQGASATRMAAPEPHLESDEKQSHLRWAQNCLDEYMYVSHTPVPSRPRMTDLFLSQNA
jgi:hypothetical protein